MWGDMSTLLVTKRHDLPTLLIILQKKPKCQLKWDLETKVVFLLAFSSDQLLQWSVPFAACIGCAAPDSQART